MPILSNSHVVTFSEPIDNMTNAELRDYANALAPFLRTNPHIVGRKLRDIEYELEVRRAAHTDQQT